MHRQSVYVDRPGLVMMTVAGAVATILASALVYLPPLAGLPLIDLPRLLGSVFSSDPGTALGVGYPIFFLLGWLVLPVLLNAVWELLPGDPLGFVGAGVKGACFGAALFVLAGLGVALLEHVGGLPGTESAGLFGLGYGWGGPLVLLLLGLLYGLALALVSAMGQGLSPVDSIGWLGHGSGHAA